LKERVAVLTNYVVHVPGKDLVGLIIRNTEIVQDKWCWCLFASPWPVKPSYDLPDMFLGKVIQSIAMFVLIDRLEVHQEHVWMPACNSGVKMKVWSLDVMSPIKKNVVVKTALNCLSYALIIAMSRVARSMVCKILLKSHEGFRC